MLYYGDTGRRRSRDIRGRDRKSTAYGPGKRMHEVSGALMGRKVFLLEPLLATGHSAHLHFGLSSSTTVREHI